MIQVVPSGLYLMPKPGKSLERLVGTIERVLCNEKCVKVESPKRLKDRTTGRLREHDVLLTIKNGHHLLRIAIECRDRSRPIGVPDVEAFWAKCQHTGINQGIMVSPKGFCGTGRKKAEHLGIRCLDIDEARTFNWLRAPGIVTITRTLLAQDWIFFPETSGLVCKDNMEVYGPDGTLVDSAILTANAQRILSEQVPVEREPTDTKELKIRVTTEGFSLRNADTGASTPVTFAEVRLTYAVTRELAPFKLSQYRDNDSDVHITDAATADFTFAERTGSLMIVYKEDVGGELVFVPHPAKKVKK